MRRESHGIFDVPNYKRMHVVIGAGLGGGSLIYADVFLIHPIFDDRLPASRKKNKLLPYYAIAKEVLGSRPIPGNGGPRRQITFEIEPDVRAHLKSRKNARISPTIRSGCSHAA